MIQFFLVFMGFWLGIRSFLKDARFQALLTNVTLLLIIGTIFYWRVEKWTLFESLYFSVITLCTVGYGDFAPETTLGRGFTIFYVLFGIGLIVAFVSYFADRTVSHREEIILRRRGTDTTTSEEEA
jgi:voltage-gated potassium channel